MHAPDLPQGTCCHSKFGHAYTACAQLPRARLSPPERSGLAARLLVHERLDVQRLHDVGVELRVEVGVADALVQQLAHLCAHARKLAAYLRQDISGFLALKWTYMQM